MGQTSLQQLSKGFGYRVINIEPQSYGSNLSFLLVSFIDLEIFLDFIIQIKSSNGLNQISLLESDEPVELQIFNIFSQSTRKIYISEPRTQTKLGLQIRMESYLEPLILHVTNVLKNSPAEQSGLSNNSDYVLGMISHKYTSINDFSDIVVGMAYAKQSIQLCIFSPTKRISPHLITLHPSFNWGGPGALGCEFASGALHTFTTNLGSQIIKNENLDQEQYTPTQIEHDHIRDKIESTEEQAIPVKGEIILSVQKENAEPIIEEQFQEQIIVQEPESEMLSETITGDADQKIIHFKGILRNPDERQEQQQVENVLKDDQKFNQFSQSFQSINASSDYSHIQQQDLEQMQQQNQSPLNESDISSQLQTNAKLNFTKLQQQTVEQPEIKLIPNQNQNQNQNSNQFQSLKRENPYLIDKKLLFDIEYEFPRYFVNIY